MSAAGGSARDVGGRLERALDDVGLRLMSPWTRPVLEASIGAAVFAAARVLRPDHDGVALFGAHLPVVCGYRLRTGQPCPMCGATRAFVHLARGHVGEALAANPVASALFVGLVGTGAVALVRMLKRDPTWARPHAAWVWAAFAAWWVALAVRWGLS